MERKPTLFLIALILLLASGSFALATQENKPDTKIDKEKCLGCHGPFEKIAEATADWQSPAGDKGTPHRFIPHDTTDVPECTECHTPHEIPPKDKESVVKPKDILFCYDSCHHAKNLQPCKNCH